MSFLRDREMTLRWLNATVATVVFSALFLSVLMTKDTGHRGAPHKTPPGALRRSPLRRDNGKWGEVHSRAPS